MTTRIPLLVLLLAAPVAAQDSLVISGVQLTVGTSRAEIERALQPRFRVELTANGDWALWDRATERTASAPVAGEPIPMPEPPRRIPYPERSVFTPTRALDSRERDIDRENAYNQAIYETQVRLYENEVKAKALKPARPTDRRLPLGYVRFSDDGKLCRVVKEWNTNGGTPADVVKALAAALGAQKGRNVRFDNLQDSPCFLFPDTGRGICAHVEGDGPVSVMEMTPPCGLIQTPPKP